MATIRAHLCGRLVRFSIGVRDRRGGVLKWHRVSLRWDECCKVLQLDPCLVCPTQLTVTQQMELTPLAIAVLKRKGVAA